MTENKTTKRAEYNGWVKVYKVNPDVANTHPQAKVFKAKMEADKKKKD